MIHILLILFYILAPAGILYLTHNFKFFDKIGAVLIAYFIGIIIPILGLLPENSAGIQNMTSEITVPLALPLLLFSLDIRKWFRLAAKTILSMVLGITSLLIMVFAGYYLFQTDIDNIYEISGLLVGVYTGGTPNLAAIKTALNISPDTYILVHTLDTLISVIYVLFFVSFAQRVILKFLPPFQKSSTKVDVQKLEMEDDITVYHGIFERKYFIPLLAAIGVSVLILAIGGGASMLLPKKYGTAVAILLITTLGIILSLSPKINQIKKTFHAGMYLILIFSIVVGSMLDIDAITETPIELVLYIGLAVYGTLMLHLFLSYLFKIDTDTTIITSTALSCSPAFVPVVAGALKNKEIVISGLTVGIIGYAIGNYLGVGVAFALQ